MASQFAATKMSSAAANRRAARIARIAPKLIDSLVGVDVVGQGLRQVGGDEPSFDPARDIALHADRIARHLAGLLPRPAFAAAKAS